MREMPAIASSSYTTTGLNLENMVDTHGIPAMLGGQTLWTGDPTVERDHFDPAHRRIIAAAPPKPKQKQIIEENEMTRRLVQVIIVDPNENVPLEQSLIHKGEPKLTDATDQELFFEVDIKQLLERHNEKRTKVIDKKVKDRTEYLEPAKIRDLKMVVVNIATF